MLKHFTYKDMYHGEASQAQEVGVLSLRLIGFSVLYENCLFAYSESKLTCHFVVVLLLVLVAKKV